MKQIKIIVLLIISILLITSCNNKENHDCNKHLSDWVYLEEVTCEKEILRVKKCNICNNEIIFEKYNHPHTFKETIMQELTCEQDGVVLKTCEVCGYNEPNITPTTGHNYIEEILREPTCTENGYIKYNCSKCHEIKEVVTARLGHEFVDEVVTELSCTEDGLTKHICQRCDFVDRTVVYATGHETGDAFVISNPTDTHLGVREFHCTKCDELLRQQSFVDNGYHKNGKLNVVGPDLVNKDNEKIQLYGLSTHGINWFGRYCNFNTIASIQEGFGNNIIRFAFYTAEGGYCEGSESKKQEMLNDLIEGIDAATKLGLYVIIDWHMVGAESVADKNPLTYLEESKEFFSYISNYYKDQDNILYEIMNEPNGSTTWAQCKKYAEQVIPCIRENSDGIILVGNPHWTADLNSVMKNPLTGFNNIMYTYHFYAASHRSTTQVRTAYDSGFPVFISEFGFMDSSGDGSLNETSGEAWKEVLDSRNISYVAWNISNSKGSASIFKYGSSDMYDVSDSNLKVWGIYLKYWYREKSGIEYLI